VIHLGAVGSWWVATPDEFWPQEPRERERLRSGWDPEFGDRKQELVFIGSAGEMDEETIRARLDACLLADEEMRGWRAWHRVQDPWPTWPELDLLEPDDDHIRRLSA
jgi:hypothetical protein